MMLAIESVSAAAIVASVSLPEIEGGKLLLLSPSADLKKEPQQEERQDVDNSNRDDSAAIEEEDKKNAESCAAEEVNQALTQEQVEETTATPEVETTVTQTKSKKNVRFDAADILEFEPSAWTATVSSDGIPVRSAA